MTEPNGCSTDFSLARLQSLEETLHKQVSTHGGEAKLRQVIAAKGFSKVRHATETPFNMVLEAARKVLRQTCTRECKRGRAVNRMEMTACTEKASGSVRPPRPHGRIT